MDNFYSSVELSEELSAIQSALKSQQGKPPNLQSAKTGTPKMTAGDSFFVNNDKVMVVAWKDKRVVTALSMKHNGSYAAITGRKKKGGMAKLNK